MTDAHDVTLARADRPAAAVPLAALEEETFVIASTLDLTPRLGIAFAAGRTITELALADYLVSNPAMHGALQIVPRFEVTELMP